MPAFTFAADNTTNQLTITGHGLTTGDGAALVRNTSGGTLPGGLAAVTEYWIVRIDANTVKLATSAANALATTPITVDITSNGTGTNVLEIGLPYRRSTTYVPGVSPVKSADLNAMQDALAALHLLHIEPGNQSTWEVRRKRAIPLSLLPSGGAGDWSWNSSGYLISVASLANGGRVQVPFEVGDVVTGLEVRVFGDGSADVTWTLAVYSASNVPTTIASATDTNRAAAWGTFAPSVTEHTMVDGESLLLSFDPNANNYRIQHAYLVYKRT